MPAVTGLPLETPAVPGGGPAAEQRQGLQIVPAITIDEMLTDNAAGAQAVGVGAASAAPGGLIIGAPQGKSADLITTVMPSLSLSDQTSRLKGGLFFAPMYQAYAANPQFDTYDFTVFGTGTAELIPEHLFLNAATSISRQVINPFGAVTVPGQLSLANQTDLRTYTVSPSWQQSLGDFATANVQYTFGETSTQILAPATENQITGSLTSSRDFGRLNWVATVQDTEINEGAPPQAPGTVFGGVIVPGAISNFADRSAQLQTGYAITRSVQFLSSAGYEQIVNGFLLGTEQGPTGSVGLGITGAYLKLDVSYEFHPYGNFLTLNGTYQVSQRIQINATYGETITTSQGLALSSVGQLQLSPGGGLVNGQTAQPFNPTPSLTGINPGYGNAAFIDRGGQVTLAAQGVRNLYTLGVVQSDMATQTPGFAEGSLGVIGGITRPISPMTQLFSNVGYTHIIQRDPTILSEDYYTASVGSNFMLANDLTFTVSYDYFYVTSPFPGLATSENAVMFALTKTF